MADQEEKTEQPTGKHLSEAFERGQFARSPEMQVAFTLAAVLGVLAFMVKASSERIEEFAIGVFSHLGASTLRQDTVTTVISDFLMTVGPLVLPVLAACAGAALLVGGLQSGFRLTPKALGFKWDRLNPSNGFSRIFSKSVFVHFAIDLLKVICIGSSLYLGARKLMLDPLFTAPVEAAYLGQFIHQAAMTFFGRMLFALGIVAAISYSYEKFKTGQELKMTREEVKDEHRNQEMEPKLKAARRRLSRRLLQRQMLAAVPTADVIVTNPTHFAVALKYERGRDQAPIVLAKGENRFAMRIKEIAAEHGVPTVENKPVARMLHALGQVGETIPPELYQAVASILAVVYRTHRYYFHRLRSRRLEATL